MGKAQLFWRILVLFCLGTFSLWYGIKKQLWDQDILDRWYIPQLVVGFPSVKYFLLRNMGKEGKQFPNDCFRPNKTCEQHDYC